MPSFHCLNSREVDVMLLHITQNQSSGSPAEGALTAHSHKQSQLFQTFIPQKIIFHTLMLQVS